MESPRRSAPTPSPRSKEDDGLPKVAVVLGAAGFIGRHLVREFESCGYFVVSADYAPDPQQPNPTTVDVTDGHSLERLWSLYPRVDLLVNLAGVIKGDDPTMECVNAIAPGLIESLCPSSVIVTLGSAAEYGIPMSDPVNESHLCAPLSRYGRTKWKATQHRGRMIVARPSSVVGSGMATSNLVGHILDSLRKGQTEIVISSLSVVRDYLSARDCARGLRLVAERGSEGNIYNLGSGKPTSIAQLKEVIQLVSGIDFELCEQPRADEIVRFVVDPSKAREELGFAAEDDLKTMLEMSWSGMQE